MARTSLSLDAENYERLCEALRNYQGNAPKVISETLWEEGGAMITEGIMQLLPESGRKWKGKKPAAKRSEPFEQTNDMMSVTIKSKNAYHYLYFPDDGSSTRKHVGNQQFMLGGAEDMQEEILQRCIAKLTNIE